jgi:tetratricopeptide (TPR) repeat protein
MVEAREDVATLLAAAGRLDEAERQLREALRIAPSSVQALVELCAVLRARGRADDAVAACEAAARGVPASIDAQAALADAHAAAGDRTGAIAAAERARSLALDQGRSATAAELERRLTSYRTGESQ